MTQRHRPPIRQFAVRMRLEIPREHREQHIGPGTRALFALMDAGYIRSEDLTVAERADIIRRMSLINKQAQEEYIAAVLTGMEVVSKASPKSAKARAPRDGQRKRGRPKGSGKLKSDTLVINEMIVVDHLVEIGWSPEIIYEHFPKCRFTPTHNFSNLLQQAAQIAKAENTTVEASRHRMHGRFRNGELRLGLASVHLPKVSAKVEALPVGFAPKPRRRKNRS